MGELIVAQLRCIFIILLAKAELQILKEGFCKENGGFFILSIGLFSKPTANIDVLSLQNLLCK